MYEYIFGCNKDSMLSTALSFYGRKISYEKLFINIKKTASAFRNKGIKAGDIVTIISLMTPETIYCIYGLNYIGAIANMAYLSLSEEEIIETIKNTKSKMVIALDVIYEKMLKVIDKVDTTIVLLHVEDSMGLLQKLVYRLKKNRVSDKVSPKIISYSHIVNTDSIDIIPIEYCKNRVAAIVYTSGTTGEPKGVLLTNENINTIALQYFYMGFDAQPGDTMMIFIPPFFAFGLSINIHMPLALGLQSDICVNPEPNNVVTEFIKNKPNYFVAAPSNILQIMEKIKGSMKWCKVFAGGGESLSCEQEEKVNMDLLEHGSNAKYSTGYGMSEFAATVCGGTNKINRVGTLGVPLCKSIVKVIDTDTQEELPYNKVGELCFHSPSQMVGYFRNDKATKEIMHVHSDGLTWIHTGDLGMVDEDGFVHFKGRLKRIYMVKGEDGTLYKLFPTRMEEELEKHELVQKCAVCVVDAPEILHKPIAFIVPSKKIAEKELSNIITNYCREILPTHSIPDQVISLNKMPMTQSGKTDYQKLEEIVKSM